MKVKTHDKTTRMLRDREIRDVYKRLGKKYKYNVMIDIITRHYFIKEQGIQHIMARVDDEPVNARTASIQYKVLTASTFKV